MSNNANAGEDSKRRSHIPTRTINSNSEECVTEFLVFERDVQDWLEKVLNTKFATQDLFRELENGVILCRLMLVLEDRSIPRYHKLVHDNKIQIKENIFHFIEGCIDYGVPKHKTFSEADLTERKNPLRVLTCLESLADVAVLKNDFAIPLENVHDPSEFSSLDKERAKVLLTKVFGNKSNVDQRNNNSSLVSRTISYTISTRGADVNKVTNGVTQLQGIVRGNITRNAYQKTRRQQAFRDKVAKEILQTEEIYVNKLNVLETLYHKPLMELAQKDKKGFPNVESVKAIFGVMETVRGLAATLLAQIQPRVTNFHASTCLGDIFLEITKFLKVYTAYVTQYEAALQIIGDLKKKSSKFAEFLEKARLDPGSDNLDIESLLILPIQRIPRYNLLLNELIKHTWSDHRDYNNLKEAYSLMKQVAEYINEKKREYENIVKVREMQDLFEGKSENLVDPSRKFVRSDIVAQWTTTVDSDKKHSEIALTLFNDMIVISTMSSGRKGTLKFLNSFKLVSVNIKEAKLRKWTMKVNENGKMWPAPNKHKSVVEEESPQSSPSSRRGSVVQIPDPDRKTYSLYSVRNTLELGNSSGETVLKVCFESPLAYASWLADFKKLKGDLEEKNSQADQRAMERAMQKVELTKNSIDKISSNLSKTVEERKAEYRRSKSVSKPNSDPSIQT